MDVVAGETRNILLAGERRAVKVIGPSDAPTWWWCVDLETGMRFAARLGWFLEPKDDGNHELPCVRSR